MARIYAKLCWFCTFCPVAAHQRINGGGEVVIQVTQILLFMPTRSAQPESQQRQQN